MIRISTIQYVDRIAEEIAVIANETTARNPRLKKKAVGFDFNAQQRGFVFNLPYIYI